MAVRTRLLRGGGGRLSLQGRRSIHGPVANPCEKKYFATGCYADRFKNVSSNLPKNKFCSFSGAKPGHLICKNFHFVVGGLKKFLSFTMHLMINILYVFLCSVWNKFWSSMEYLNQLHKVGDEPENKRINLNYKQKTRKSTYIIK